MQIPDDLPDDLTTGRDHSKAYTEACNMLRHYSGASFGIRSASIVQGVAILVVWVTTTTQDKPKWSIAFALPIAGLIFAGLLYRFHRGYFKATEFFYRAAARLEVKLFDKDCRPIKAYDKLHGKIYAGFAARFFTLNAPFTLIVTFCIAALIVDLVVFLR